MNNWFERLLLPGFRSQCKQPTIDGKHSCRRKNVFLSRFFPPFAMMDDVAITTVLPRNAFSFFPAFQDVASICLEIRMTWFQNDSGVHERNVNIKKCFDGNSQSQLKFQRAVHVTILFKFSWTNALWIFSLFYQLSHTFEIFGSSGINS